MDGVDGLLSAYWDSVSKVKLYGPTNFADVINRTALVAKVVFFFPLRALGTALPDFLFSFLFCSVRASPHHEPRAPSCRRTRPLAGAQPVCVRVHANTHVRTHIQDTCARVWEELALIRVDIQECR